MTTSKEIAETRRALIEVYFLSLKSKYSNIVKIADIGNEESLVLSCCLIEALATRKYKDYGDLSPGRRLIPNFSKAQAFTEFLQEYSGFGFWKQVFSEAVLNYLPEKLFPPNDYEDIYHLVVSLERRLYSEAELLEILLQASKNKRQEDWLSNHLCKASVGSLVYSDVRSQLVHDVSHNVFTTRYLWDGKPIPEINSSFMAQCLLNIINSLEQLSIDSLTFWWEQ